LLQPIDNNIDKLKNLIKQWQNIKWINEQYPKKNVLFGLNDAKKSILKNQYVIVVEGYMDAISLWINGFQNTVAICGTAMSPMHLLLLRRYTNHIVFCLDADKGGERGLQNALKNMNKINIDMTYYNVLLPALDGQKIDPEDVLLSKDKEILKWALKEAGKRKNVKDEKKVIKINDDKIKLLYQIKQGETIDN